MNLLECYTVGKIQVDRGSSFCNYYIKFFFLTGPQLLLLIIVRIAEQTLITLFVLNCLSLLWNL